MVADVRVAVLLRENVVKFMAASRNELRPDDSSACVNLLSHKMVSDWMGAAVIATTARFNNTCSTVAQDNTNEMPNYYSFAFLRTFVCR